MQHRGTSNLYLFSSLVVTVGLKISYLFFQSKIIEIIPFVTWNNIIIVNWENIHACFCALVDT